MEILNGTPRAETVTEILSDVITAMQACGYMLDSIEDAVTGCGMPDDVPMEPTPDGILARANMLRSYSFSLRERLSDLQDRL